MHAMKPSRLGTKSKPTRAAQWDIPPSTMIRPGLAEIASYDKAKVAALGCVDQNRMTLAIYQGLLGAEPWRETAIHLGAYFSANAIIVIRPSTSVDLGFTVCHPRNPEIEEAYRAHFWTMDPFLDLPIDQVVTIDEFMGMKNWYASEFYQRFIGEGGVNQGLGVNIVSANGTVCRVRLYRSPHEPAFVKGDKQRLQGLLAHFGQALSLAARMDCHQAQSELYEGALDRLHIGAIVLDENQVMLRCNHFAKTMLDGNDGLKWAGRGVEAYYRHERGALQDLINGAGPNPRVMSISRASGKRKLGLVVRGIPLRADSEGKGRPASVIFICDPDAQTIAPREILRQVFDFTPSEAMLAMELANGLSVDEAAEVLGIRRNTARTHLRAIFAKAGVARQAELVRLILNGVVGLSSPIPGG